MAKTTHCTERLRCRLPCAITLLLLMTAPVAASASSNVRTGLYLRATAGIGGGFLDVRGYHAGTNEHLRVEADQTGLSGLLDFAAGVFIARTVVMHVEFGALLLPSPASSYETTRTPRSATGAGTQTSAPVDANLLSTSVRLGFTGYLMPSRVFIGSSLGVNWLSLGNGWRDVETELGISATVRVGKEWMLEEHLDVGFGLLLEYVDREIPGNQVVYLASSPAPGNLGDTTGRLGLFWLGAVFSVVWN